MKNFQSSFENHFKQVQAGSLSGSVADKQLEDEVSIELQGGMTLGNQGYVEHSIVRYRGTEIGKIQVKCQPGGIEEALTIAPNNQGTKVGRRIGWLIELAERDGWLGQNKELLRRQLNKPKRKNFNQ